MNGNKNSSSLEGTFYYSLATINKVKFTPREIDIMACILGGRTAKKIASLLSINPRTVETHTRNIIRKLECNSQEGIRDFIERSDKFAAIKAHYLILLGENNFAQILQKIYKLVDFQSPLCMLVSIQKHEDIYPLLRYLKLAGIKIKLIEGNPPPQLDKISDMDYLLYVLSKSWIKLFRSARSNSELEFMKLEQRALQHPGSVILLLKDPEPITRIFKRINNIGYVDFTDQNNYYFSTLELLKRILPNINLEPLIAEFKEQNFLINPSPKFSLNFREFDNNSVLGIYYLKKLGRLLKKSFRKRSILTLILIFILGSITQKIIVGKKNEKASFSKNIVKDNFTIQSDLPIPPEATFLQRPKLLSQMEQKIENQKGIRTIALIGLGGVGKTTLARQYAHYQTCPIVWEINAETLESLMNSFENLADLLATTEAEKRALKEFKDVKNIEERLKKIIFFIKQKLKQQPDWLLIFDNIENVTFLQKYFPHDSKAWGKGTIILTTRDSNITNNCYVNNSIQIGELNSSEKLELFLKIINNGYESKVTSIQKEQAKKFLKSIPPFPLDISMAVYYLKATNTPYEKYLEYLNEPKEGFSSIQEDVLKKASHYTKTRYSIIALSLKKLMETQQDFSGLLVFISLLDSQDIPRALLEAYTSEIIVDNFIYNLKKYSLITNESLNPLETIPSFSLHRSTQEIALIYLTKALGLKRGNHLLQSITRTLEKYIGSTIDVAEFSHMAPLISHCEKYLSHENFLTDIIKVPIKIKLGGIYCYLGQYFKGKHLLEQSLIILNKNPSSNLLQFALTLGYLGNVHRCLGEYEKAKILLERSLVTYQKHFSTDYVGIALIFTYLGLVDREGGKYEEAKGSFEKSLKIYKNHLPEQYFSYAQALGYLAYVHKELGHYLKAEELLEQSYIIYKKHYQEAPLRAAWLLGYLGITYNELGEYERAREWLEESLTIYKKHSFENHTDYAFILALLGRTYEGLENYIKSKEILEQSIIIYKRNFPPNHIHTTRAEIYLANVYAKLGEHKKAKTLLKKAFAIYQRNYGKDHIKPASILRELGQVYLLESNLKIAEYLFKQSLGIYQRSKHTDSYLPLESLGTLYLEKANCLTGKDKIIYQKQSAHYLQQALEIVIKQFPRDSPHIKRIQTKLKKCQ